MRNFFLTDFLLGAIIVLAAVCSIKILLYIIYMPWIIKIFREEH